MHKLNIHINTFDNWNIGWQPFQVRLYIKMSKNTIEQKKDEQTLRKHGEGVKLCGGVKKNYRRQKHCNNIVETP